MKCPSNQQIVSNFNIESGFRYTCEEELLDDLRLMFNNCRQYNEEGSVIYEDANMLERVLLDKARELGLALAASAKPKR